MNKLFVRTYSDYYNLEKNVCCNNKTVGPIGPVGPTGIFGPTGAWGISGPQGLEGPQGPTGEGWTGCTGPVSYIPQSIIATNGVSFSSNNLSLSPDFSNNTILSNTSFQWSINSFGKSTITDLSVNNISITSINDCSTNLMTDYNGITSQVYIFNSDGSFNLLSSDPSGGIVNMCLIGGGGGGIMDPSGVNGSGAGQLLFIDNYLLPNGTYNINVGSGGLGVGGDTSGNNGNFTNITDISLNSLFAAAGGASASSWDSSKNGISGTIIYDSSNTILVSSGTSSSSGGGKGYNIPYNYNPYLNLGTIWSYGNSGGTTDISSVNISCGGGGGAGGAGSNGTYNIGGLGGPGLFIYFDTSGGRKVCGGSSGSNTQDYSDPSYNNGSYSYPYPYPYSYGAGKLCTDSSNNINANENTGSGGGSGKNVNGGNGGSGLFMIRFPLLN